MIGAIVAVDKNGLIGYDGGIPWREPADLKRFKEITTGSVVIMGRKTFDSIGKCLPNRVNIVVSSRSVGYWLAHEAGSTDDSLIRQIPIVSKSMKDALTVATQSHPSLDIWIIGGAQIYKEAFRLGVVKRVEVTTVLRDIHVDEFEKAVYFDKRWLADFRHGEVTISGNLAFTRYDWYESLLMPHEMESIKIEMKGFFARPPLGALLEDEQGNQWVVIGRSPPSLVMTDRSTPNSIVLELYKPKFNSAGFSWPVGRLFIIDENFRPMEEKN